MRLNRTALVTVLVAALAACATPAPPPPPKPDYSMLETLPYAPPKFVLLPLPFAPFDTAELEPLPEPAGDLWDRIVRGYGIPDLEGPLVEKWEKYYSDRPDYVARMIERSRRYLYHIVSEVEGRDMPTEIALLPMVESAFNPNAMSVARAAGMWQFMPSTGQHFGLKQNWWFDSRRDVLAATTSALDYLQRLHDEFDDWQLALAAYNWGEGNVRRAVARNKAKGLPTGFSDLTGMPVETQNYVPKLQAVKNIVIDPGKYNLSLGDLPDAPFFTVVKTTLKMDVKRAAELAELPLDEFLALNPQHNRPVIAGADEYAILLPIDNAETFAAKLELIDQPLVSWQAYRLKPNETLPQIAAKYGMSAETLLAVNGIGPRARVPTGHTLLVPSQRPGAESANSLSQAVFTSVPSGRTVYYTVRRGDTLVAIAARYGVAADDVRHWNNLTQNKVAAGQRLRIVSDAGPAAKRHVKARRQGSAKAASGKSARR
ncbi:MAG TPA: transglycosylase SLT domain-containing protein [Casimicrobiaceae bacterium]|nr:transglycosylase SLT domain-containing protein [Casimicrobiaceae bacterium]